MRRTAWPYALPATVALTALIIILLIGLPPAGHLLVIFLSLGCLLTLAFSRSRLAARIAESEETSSASPAQEAIYVFDKRGHLRWLNPAAEHLLGTVEIGGKGAKAVPLHVLDGSKEPWLDAALAGRSIRGEGVIAAHRGDVPVSYVASPITAEGDITGVVLLLADLTERVEPEGYWSVARRYSNLVEALPDGMLVIDAYGFVVLANRAAGVLHGYDDEDQLVGKRLQELVEHGCRVNLAKETRAVAEHHTSRVTEYSALRQDGASFPAEASIAPVGGLGDDTDGVLVVIRDITRHKQAQAILQASRERANLQQEVGVILSQSTSLAEAMPRLLEALGRSSSWDAALYWQTDELALLRAQYVWSSTLSATLPFLEASKQVSFGPGTGLPGQAWSNNKPVWVEDLAQEQGFERAPAASQGELRSILCFPLIAGAEFQGIVELACRDTRSYDQTLIDTLYTVGTAIGQFIKRKQAERDLEHQALHDRLTNLPNRNLFARRLERAVKVATTSARPLAVLLMDMDRFKEVNDTFGHQYGDLLLQQVAVRLAATLRESDTVARLGGDEFALLLPGNDEAGAIVVAERIIRCIEAPFSVEDQVLDVGISIGIALHPDHGDDPTTLMRHADTAMYQAKRGQLGYTVYAPQEDEHSPGRFAFSGELRRAIDQGELFLHYQPKLNLRTGRVDTVEALVRWHHPEKGLVRPDEFIPVAEQTGLIKQLTYWVLHEALRQVAVWQREDVDLRVAVNLSVQNLHDPGLVTMICQLLDQEGVEPRSLAVEVTESAIMVNAEGARKTLAELKRLGVRISIDDFGTGYSSLAYLLHLPSHEVKIDKSFVLDMLQGTEGALIARTVIDLGHNLGLEVVAEGVENEETCDLLRHMDCDQVQGYYLSRPIPPNELMKWIRDRDLVPEGDIEVLPHAS